MNDLQFTKEISKGKFHNIYLFYGEEQYLKEEAFKRMKQKIVNPQYESFNYTFINGEKAVVEGIVDACETLPFMDRYRLVLVKDLHLLSAENLSQFQERQLDTFMEYLGRIPQSTVLVLYQKGNIDKRRKPYRTIKQTGAVVDFEYLNPAQMRGWIEGFFKNKGRTVDNKAIDFIMENLSENLGTLVNEMNKLFDYIGDKKHIQVQDVESTLSRTLEHNIFNFVDSVSGKKTDEALRIFNEMTTQGEAVVKIMAMISSQFALIYTCKLLMEKGLQVNEIIKKLGIHPFRVKKALEQGRYFSIHELKKVLALCLEADENIKTGKMDVKLAVELLIIQI